MRKFFTLLFMLLVSQIILGYDLQVDGIKYNIIGNTNDLSIVEVSFEGPITIPSTVTYKNKTYNVVKIGDYAFRNHRTTTLSIGKNLNDLGNLTSSECNNFTNFIVDEENETFSSEDGVLFNKDKTTLIIYPGGSGRTSYTIPQTVKEIKAESFSYCDLVDVTFGNSVKSIGAYAFAGCDNLKNVILGDSVQNIGSRAFRYCDALEYFNFGKSLEKIPDDVCDYCVKLKKVEIPTSVISINVDAFRECNALDSIILYGANPPSIVGGMSNEGILSSVSRLATVIVPCGSLETYNNAAGWNNFLAIEESNIFQYSFSVTSEDSNKGTVNIDKKPACGVNAEFVAIANQGYQFQKWSDGNTENPRSLAVNEDVSLKAIFIAKEESDFTEGTFVAKPFSISEDKTITFSPGNLQYHAVNDEWRFAPSQLDYIGYDNNVNSSTFNGWIDLFGWGTGNNPTITNEIIENYPTFVDWGINKIGNDAPNTWRTLTHEEWNYIIKERTNASNLIGIAQVDGVNCLIILPDNWICPSGVTFKPGCHTEWGMEYYNVYQSINSSDWSKLEESGAILLPVAGYRISEGASNVQYNGNYYSSSEYGNDHAYCLYIDSNAISVGGCNRVYGRSVRLVKDNIVQEEENVSGTANGHEYVDLGLPSGNLWATCNVGAESPEDYGDYFAWGETEPKECYSQDNYKWYVGTSYTKYNNTDKKTTLELSDDAANVNWGGDWRMPTRAEHEELTNHCSWTWTTINNINGYMINFLPSLRINRPFYLP